MESSHLLQQVSGEIMQLALGETKGFVLRDYQAQCLTAIKTALAKSVNNQLVVMATGSGKTVVFAHLPETLGLDKKMLVLAHRHELLEQASNKIRSANPNLSVFIEQAGRKAAYYADVVVASIATIGRKGSSRLNKFDPAEFGLIICDEAHHSVSSSYKAVFDHFPDVPRIGFTATPSRADGIGLENVYDEIVFERNTRWLMEHGYLCKVAGYSVDSKTDLSGVSTRMGDFATNELSFAVDTPERNRLVIESYQHLIPGQKAIVFGVNVEHVEHLTELFQSNGIAAACVTGTTMDIERAQIFENFKCGSLRVIVNCMVCTEGYDEPSIEAVIMARPTKSSTLYQQAIGRGMRLHPGKEKLTVVDVADNSSRCSLVSVSTVFGLPPRFNAKGKDLLEAVAEFEKMPPHLARKVRDYDDFIKLVKEVDLFAVPPERDELVAKHSKLMWILMPDGSYHLSLTNKGSAMVTPDLLGRYHVTYNDGETAMVVGSYSHLKEAFQAADNRILGRQDAVLYQASASWRKKPASPGQLAQLNRMRVKYRPGISRGEASDLISERIKR